MLEVCCYPSVAHSCALLYAGGMLLSECCSFLCSPICWRYVVIRVLLILVLSDMLEVCCYPSVAHSCALIYAGGMLLSECCSFLCSPICWRYVVIRVLLILVLSYMLEVCFRVLLILVLSYMLEVCCYPSVAHSCALLYAGGMLLSECCSFLCSPICWRYVVIRVLLILVLSYMLEVCCYPSVAHSCALLYAGGMLLSECCSFLCSPICWRYVVIRVLRILVLSYMLEVCCYPSVAHSCALLYAGGMLLSECCSFLCFPICWRYVAIRVLLILVLSYMLEVCCYPSVAHSCAFKFYVEYLYRHIFLEDSFANIRCHTKTAPPSLLQEISTVKYIWSVF